MTAHEYLAAYNKYHWPVFASGLDVNRTDKEKPLLLFNEINLHDVMADTPDGYIDVFDSLPKHAKNLPVSKTTMSFARRRQSSPRHVDRKVSGRVQTMEPLCKARKRI
jgi:hypothetical protein